MCGPTVPWDLFVLDMAYVLVLVGGSMVLRARQAMPITWILFGLLSVAVGGPLLYATYAVQVAAGDTAELAASTAIVYFDC